jgi:hypothetical protein
MKLTLNTSTAGKFVPLYEHRKGDSAPMGAFLELDHRTGLASFGKRRDHIIPDAEANGLVSRWTVPAALRGDYSMVLLKKFNPLLQTMLDGCSEELVDRDDGDFDLVGVLDDSAMAASEEIGSVVAFIDRADPFQVAAVWDPGRMVRDYVEINDVDPMMTDEQLEQLSREYLAAAKEEGIHVDGSLNDELITMRDNMREDQDGARL